MVAFLARYVINARTPDILIQRVTRKEALGLLANKIESLIEIMDSLKGIESVCIEPRGVDRHRRALRAEIEDITILEQ